MEYFVSCALRHPNFRKMGFQPPVFPHFPESSSQSNFLRLFGILCLAADISLRTTAAVLTTVPCGGYKLPVLQFCTLSPQRKLSAFCTGKAIFVGVIGHVLDSANLLLKAFGSLCFIVRRLDEAELSVPLEKKCCILR